MNKYLAIATILLAFLNASTFLQAQSSEVGFCFGASNYKGDVSPRLSIGNTSVGMGGFYKKHITHALHWRTNADIDLLSADYQALDDDRLSPIDYSFSTTALSLSTGIEYNFFDFGKKYNPLFTPYLFGQIGGVLPSTTTSFNGQEAEVSNPSVILPFGIGVKAVVSRRVVLAVEWRTTKVFSDQLDGVPFESNQGNVEANTSALDTYYRLNFSVSFIPTKIRCPRNTPKDRTFDASRDY